ncbi:hypothetical protein HMPREF1214_02498 [Bacteroides sp. HPS0048]|uniref:hypothetical protein n=1 Tax=Bacteroides sp. HPS0048 TaxID=1078089 RepID=UPI000377F00E|nr:hypothetical protein [Bacteroides sp. HPS0048]EOA57465.1 hypothetical protein HMPREF1214_02498 [Bacteroides sp. HPS0048]
MAIFNRTYSPLRTQLSMLVTEGSLTQDYDADNKVYTPDRRIRPTAIQPMCSIIDPSGILVNGVVNRYITDIKWYENEISEENLISASNAKFSVDSTSDTNNRGRIIVMKNVAFDAPVTLIFTATFVDMVNGKLRRKAYFVGRSVLASNVAASSPLVLKTDYPRGRCFNPIKEPDHLKLSADLVSGDTSVPAAFWWYKKNGLNESLITDYVGHNLRELRVPASSIGKEQHYVCKAQDCRQNLTDVRNTYIEEGLNKISGYPRNLLAKQYFLDLNDEIKPGVVTEGEDADGKYICIPNPPVLRTYVGLDKFGDLFSGKISFKENTVYVVRIKGKSIGNEGATTTGLMFTIVYTDGKYINFPVSGINATNEIVRTTQSGKTVSHISCTYGNNYPTYIYDVQITEDYNYNLLEGDTEEVVVTSSMENPNSYKKIKISKALSVGKKITVKLDGIENLVGEATEYSVNFMQGAEVITSGHSLKSNYKTHVFTINDKYDPTGEPVYLILYAGKSLETAGNSVKYKNVQLLEGEYAWNVLGEDVEELTVTASESQNQKSDKIEIKNKLQASGKYTIEVGEIINLKGTPESYTVLLYQSDGVNTQVSNSLDLSPSKTTGVFTLNNNYNPELATYLFFYAGKINETAGNSVQFTNIRLLQGETVPPSMPAYTPHFIPSAPDIEVESERITLPEGYRPDVQGKTIDHEFTLVTRLPPYRTSVVTPYGDDSGVISIPSDVKLFPARIKVDVSGIGTLDHPERYFSADWGNGLKGMNVLLDADDIGLGVQAVEPDVVEGLGYVKYAASGCSLSPANRDKVEEPVVGSRLVVEIPPNIPNSNAYISTRKDGVGLLMMYNPNGNVSLFIYGYNKRMSTVIKYVESVIQRYELRIGATLEECQLFLNGKLYAGTFGNIENGGGTSFDIDADSRASLIEFYSPDNVLLHKWDFEGSTDDERLSDKADTGNKLNFSKSEGFKLLPV